MSVKNPLRYLILLEGGIVALLATALARHDDAEPSKSQRKLWDGFAGLCGLELSSDGPKQIEVEKYRVDLLAAWDHWAIMLEAKTKRQHVKGGQLQAYYNRLRLKLGKPGILAEASSILVLFLTPTDVGTSEFESLSVEGNDRKRHIDWKDVLSIIDSTFSSTSVKARDDSPLYPLVTMGAKRIRELLNIADIVHEATPKPGAAQHGVAAGPASQA